jgi:hypothetical protein
MIRAFGYVMSVGWCDISHIQVKHMLDMIGIIIRKHKRQQQHYGFI